MAFIGLGRPGQQQVGAEPAIGDRLPSAEAFRCERPLRCIAFLRHVGCPFAEKTVRALRNLGASEARLQVFFVGHGDRGTTVKWLAEIGGAAAATWVDDPTRRLYGNCGLGFSRAAHFLGRASLTGALALRRDGVEVERAAVRPVSRSDRDEPATRRASERGQWVSVASHYGKCAGG